MEVFAQIWREATQPVNLPFTGFLTCCMLYWSLVILGCFTHGDADAGQIEAGHGGLETDLPAGGEHADLSGDTVEGGGHHEVGDTHMHGLGQSAEPLLRFLHWGEMPVVPLLSLMSLLLWLFALWGNHVFNPGHAWSYAALLLIPNLLLTGILVHFLAYPVKKVFQTMNRDADAAPPIVGSICQVITQTVTAEFGEATIESKGAPLQIHARTLGDEVLRQGEQAVVISENPALGTYNVTGLKTIQKQLGK